MFNIGPGELIAISMVALLVLGPQRLPEAVRTVGRVIGELRRISGGFQDELRNALDDDELGDLTSRRSTYEPPPSLPPLPASDDDPAPATVVERPEPADPPPAADAPTAADDSAPADAPPAADPQPTAEPSPPPDAEPAPEDDPPRRDRWSTEAP